MSAAALLAAMELIRGLSDHPAATPADQLLDDLQQAQIRPEELTRAFAALLYGFLQVFNNADVDMIVGSVTRRLRRLQLVPEPMVTRMHGAMGAAAAGRSPLGWRERFGPMPPGEALAWAYTTWLLADLLGYLGEQRGERERFSDRVVRMLPTGQASWPSSLRRSDQELSCLSLWPLLRHPPHGCRPPLPSPPATSSGQPTCTPGSARVPTRSSGMTRSSGGWVEPQSAT